MLMLTATKLICTQTYFTFTVKGAFTKVTVSRRMGRCWNCSTEVIRWTQKVCQPWQQRKKQCYHAAQGCLVCRTQTKPCESILIQIKTCTWSKIFICDCKALNASSFFNIMHHWGYLHVSLHICTLKLTSLWVFFSVEKLPCLTVPKNHQSKATLKRWTQFGIALLPPDPIITAYTRHQHYNPSNHHTIIPQSLSKTTHIGRKKFK